MKHLARLSSLSLIVCVVSLLAVLPSWAVPSLPSSFYGTVKVNGANVPDGTVIQALSGSQVYAEGVSQTYQGNSVYALDVRGDNTDTVVQDGGREGDVVYIAVGGVLADQTGVWHSGTNVELNLTITASGEPIWTPVPTIPTPTSTATVRPSATPTRTPISPQQPLPTVTPVQTTMPVPTTTPLPVQSSSPTAQSSLPIASSTPLQKHPTSQVLAPTPTAGIAPTERATSTLTPEAQHVAAGTESPVTTSTVISTSTAVAVAKQSSAVVVVPKKTEESAGNDAASDTQVSNVQSSTAWFVIAIGSAVIGLGLVFWATRRVK